MAVGDVIAITTIVSAANFRDYQPTAGVEVSVHSISYQLAGSTFASWVSSGVIRCFHYDGSNPTFIDQDNASGSMFFGSLEITNANYLRFWNTDADENIQLTLKGRQTK